MPFLTGLQSDLIREAFDNLHAASEADKLDSFWFAVERRYEESYSPSNRTCAARALEVTGLVEYAAQFVCNTDPGLRMTRYTPTEQGIDEALRLGVISIADVTGLSAARKRAELRAKGGV